MGWRALRIATTALLLGLLTLPAVAGKGPRRPRRTGTVIFKVRESATPADLQRLSAVLRTRRSDTVRSLRTRGARLERFPGREMTEEEQAGELLATGAVEFAEPDYLVAATQIPNDPHLGSQWQHTKINSGTAWNTTTGSALVKVGVCDTGISSAHPDLAANLLLPGYNAVDGSTNSEPIYNHGTGVAGCIGAVGNNGTGVAGVAWGGVKILPIRISNQSNGSAYISDASDGIHWAADQGAKVVNLSFRMAGYSTIDAAANYLRSKGGLLFVAAGNDGQDPGWTDFPSFVSVSATTSSDALASWSNRGTYVDVAAPGSGVYSTTGGSSYGSMSGTSFASPIAAGVAALLFSIDPNFTPAQVEGFLFSSCADLGAAGEDSAYGHGRIDAAAAVALASGTSTSPNLSPVAVASATPTSGMAPLAVAFDGSASSDPDGQIHTWSWSFGDGATGTGQFPSHTYGAAGTYTATLTVTDDRGGTASQTVSIAASQDPTKVVYVDDIAMTSASVPGGWTGRATVTIVDAHGAPRPGATVTGAWTGRGSGTVAGTTDGTGRVTLVSAKTKASSAITFTVTWVEAPGYAYDQAQNVESSDSIGGGSGNEPPTAAFTTDVLSGAPPLAVTFDASDSVDVDGSISSYAWAFGDGETGAGEVVSHTYTSAGTFTATLEVTDNNGAKDSAWLSITVVGDATKTVYVSSIDVYMVPGKGGEVPTADVILSLLDGKIAAGATVTGRWSGIVNGTSSGGADQDGVACLHGRKTKKAGSIRLEVDHVALPGYVFDPHRGMTSATVSKAATAKVASSQRPVR